MTKSIAWVFLFFPALFYYAGTRLYTFGLFRSSSYGEIMPHELTLRMPTSSTNLSNEVCSEFLSSNNQNPLVYLKSNDECRSLRFPLFLVADFTSDSVVATTWMHDEELGRGYLLISTSAARGKIYQWETGGGPIVIGRTLHLKDSGCRSNLYKKCSAEATENRDAAADDNTGSGGIAVDTFSSDSSHRLIVAEYGEGRVVRLEQNGAR